MPLAALAQLLTLGIVLAGVSSETTAISAPLDENWLEVVPPKPPPGVVRGSLTFEQAEPFYRLLAYADAVDAAALAAAADARHEDRLAKQPNGVRYSQFADLLKNPADWQGQAIRLSGHLNKLTRVPAGENEFGIDSYYEGWLVTGDSQQYPTVVIAANLPAAMPLGEEIVSGVEVTGYVFKLHAYPARDGKGRLAPMVMTGELIWRPPTKVKPLLSETGRIVVVGLITAVLVGGIVALSRRSRRPRAVATSSNPFADDSSEMPMHDISGEEFTGDRFDDGITANDSDDAASDDKPHS